MKYNLCVAVLGLTLLGTASSPLAADQPALDDNLKPMAKGLGQWSYIYKDDKGREFPSTFTSTVAAGGKIIIGKDQSIKDGKILWSSLNISYWQPETKSIASFYIDSSGMHANSILTKSGNIQVWQGYGYDAKGKYGSAVSTVEYQGDDTFVSRLTHFIVQGQVLPDTPILTIKRTQDIPAQVIKQPRLNRKLKPLTKTLGKWSYRWPSDKGESSNAKENRSVDLDGAVCTLEGEDIDNNGKVYSYYSINYWQAEAKSIGTVWFDSDGRHSFASVNGEHNKVIWQNHGYDGNGTFETFVESNEFPDADTILYQMTHHVIGGELKPDEPKDKLTIKRLKE